jgi:hypothetical protein
MGKSPINFGLLSGNGNILKLEMTTKLKDKQTSIATDRDLLRTFANFLAPLLSHCRLPLNGRSATHSLYMMCNNEKNDDISRGLLLFFSDGFCKEKTTFADWLWQTATEKLGKDAIF